MIDWVNAVLRTVMCMGFLLLVVRPMLLAFSRKEVNRLEIEDAAESSVNSAFNAWRVHHGRHYYDNPEYAEMMASNPNLELPDLSKPAPEPEPVVAAEPPVETEETSASNAAETAQASEAVETASEALSAEATPPETTEATEGTSESAEKTEVALVEEPEPEEENSMEAMKAKMAAEKKKAKPPSIPPELMNNANSFDDKLMLVQMIVQQEQGRVAGVLKKMIQG